MALKSKAPARPKPPEVEQFPTKIAPDQSPKQPKTPRKRTPRAIATDRARSNLHYHTLDPYDKAMRAFRNRARPAKPRKGSARDQDQRIHDLAQAYCAWSDLDEVVRIYLGAALMNTLGWGVYVVDHAVPISGIGDLVRGLHTHTNLQVITARENKRKGNWLWPDMPDLNWGTIDLLTQVA